MREKQSKQTMDEVHNTSGGWNDYSDAAEENQDVDGDNENEEAEEQEQTTGSSHASSIIFSDEIESVGAVRCNTKVKGFTFSPVTSSSAADGAHSAMVTLTNNSIELYSLAYKLEGSSLAMEASKASILDLHGHRSDIRAVAVSSDNTTLATCSSEGIKVSDITPQNLLLNWKIHMRTLTYSCGVPRPKTVFEAAPQVMEFLLPSLQDLDTLSTAPRMATSRLSIPPLET
jgi:WD40 repeat protein